MDNNIREEHWKIIAKHYPNMNITQLGMVLLMLGVIRASMGHEEAKATIRDYIHKAYLSPDIKQCVDFIEREVIGLKKSKLDIDFWKRGKKGQFRRDRDLKEVSI